MDRDDADTVPPLPYRSPYVLFPIEYPAIWDAYKLAQASYWTADEVDLTEDAVQWRTSLTEDEREFLSFILGFFATADGIVVENLALRFSNEVQMPEAKCFYAMQQAIENVHSEVYSRLIQELIDDAALQSKLFHAIELLPAVKAKAEWCLEWTNSMHISFSARLVAFAIVEGIFFSSSFAAIFWLRDRNLMPGLTFANELIARDEGQHTDFVCLLYNHLPERLGESEVHKMIKDAVLLEHAFFSDAIRRPLAGLNAEMMLDYVEYVADYLLLQLGYSSLYNKPNPFPYIDRTALDVKTNFFERSVSEYSVGNVTREHPLRR